MAQDSLRLLGGIQRLVAHLPTKLVLSLKNAASPRTLLAVVGALEAAVDTNPESQEEAIRAGALKSVCQTLRLIARELKQPSHAGLLDELLPNLLTTLGSLLNGRQSAHDPILKWKA